MAKRKAASLAAVQTTLFGDPDRRRMTWRSIPEPLRGKVVACLAQLLRESRDEDAAAQHEDDDE